MTSLIADQPSILASRSWCTVPFERVSKSSFDELVDILLQLPSFLPCRNEIRKISFSNPTRAGLMQRELALSAGRLLSSLDEFWQRYKNEIDPLYDNRLQEIACAANHVNEDWFEQDQVPCTHNFPFAGASDAYFTAMYNAGRLIVLGLLASVSAGVSWYNYNRDVVMQGTSILAAAAYCENLGLLNGVSFSMVFPIKLVCLLSPSEEQRAYARKALLEWVEKRGLGDTCQVAAPSYLDRSHG
jgi:hypothetical protein